MQYTKIPQGYLLRLVKGEDIHQTLLEFCTSHQMQSGFFHAIGATVDLELGAYHLAKKDYTWKKFTSELEIVSLTGNISTVDGKPFAHIHGIFSGADFQCIGGHVKQATVGATCEIYLVNFEKEITREFDEEVGLKLLKCDIQSS